MNDLPDKISLIETGTKIEEHISYTKYTEPTPIVTELTCNEFAIIDIAELAGLEITGENFKIDEVNLNESPTLPAGLQVLDSNKFIIYGIPTESGTFELNLIYNKTNMLTPPTLNVTLNVLVIPTAYRVFDSTTSSYNGIYTLSNPDEVRQGAMPEYTNGTYIIYCSHPNTSGDVKQWELTSSKDASPFAYTIASKYDLSGDWIDVTDITGSKTVCKVELYNENAVTYSLNNSPDENIDGTYELVENPF